MSIDIDETIERYKEEAKLYENDIVVYSHVTGFIHVLEKLKQQNKTNTLALESFRDKVEKLKEEKEWAETVAQNRLEGNEILESTIDRLENKVEQLKEKEKQLGNLSTKELVNELKEREGVASEQLKPHEEYRLYCKRFILQDTGPAKILLVTD